MCVTCFWCDDGSIFHSVNCTVVSNLLSWTYLLFWQYLHPEGKITRHRFFPNVQIFVRNWCIFDKPSRKQIFNIYWLTKRYFKNVDPLALTLRCIKPRVRLKIGDTFFTSHLTQKQKVYNIYVHTMHVYVNMQSRAEGKGISLISEIALIHSTPYYYLRYLLIFLTGAHHFWVKKLEFKYL